MNTIYRFMGNVEHTLLCQGRTIENHTQHGKLRGDASTSVGFCFGFGDENDAVHQSRFLNRIVTMQWLMVAEVSEEQMEQMHVGKGRYIYDPRTDKDPEEDEYSNDPEELENDDRCRLLADTMWCFNCSRMRPTLSEAIETVKKMYAWMCWK